MKQTTYTLSLGGNDSGDSKVSKMEKKFEKYMEGSQSGYGVLGRGVLINGLSVCGLRSKVAMTKIHRRFYK